MLLKYESECWEVKATFYLQDGFSEGDGRSGFSAQCCGKVHL